MSSRSLLLTALLSLPVAGLAWLATGDEETRGPVPSRLPPELLRRAEQLSSQDPRARSEAERDLLRFGTAGVDRTLAALPTDDGLTPGDRAAVARLRDRLRRLVTDTEAAATRVTTPGTVETMADLAPFLDRAGNHLRLLPAQEPRPVRLAFDAAPFWQAVDEAAARAGLVPDGVHDTGSAAVLTFRERPPAGDRTAIGHAGPFRLAAVVVPSEPVESESRHIRIRLAVTAEPRLRPLVASGDAAGFTLAAADGTRIAAVVTPPGAEFPWLRGDGTARLTLDAVVPPDPPPLTLTGRLDVVTVTATEWFSFHFDESDSTQDRHGVEARLDAAHFGRDATEIEIAFAHRDEKSPPVEPDAARRDHTAAALYHAVSPSASVDVSLPTSVQAGEHEGAIHVRYRFAPLPESPAYLALVCRIPRRVARLSVPIKIVGLHHGE